MDVRRENRPILRARRKSPGRPLVSYKYTESIKLINSEPSVHQSYLSDFEIPCKKMKKTPTDVKEHQPYLCSVLHGVRSCKLLFQFVKLSITLSLLFAWLFTLALWHKNQCDLESEEFNLQINEKLSACVIGQENSIHSIIKLLEIFRNDVNNSSDKQIIHLMWWVGSIGVGKTMTSKVLVNSFKGVHVVKHIISSSDNADKVDSLAIDLISELHCCKINLFILDGYNAENDSSTMLLEKILYHIHKNDRSEFTKHFCLPYKILFIASGIHQSKIITKQYLSSKSLYNEDPRSSASVNALTVLLKDKFILKDEYKLIKNVEVVPFLPLEFTHMDKCILQNLNERLLNVKCYPFLGEQLEMLLKFHSLSFNSISKQIKQNLQAYPFDNPVILSAGCKSISRKIRLIVNSSKYSI